MKEEPLVSVVMSTLNTDEEFLKLSINSILKQSYNNIEFIIIIDGGNDDNIIKNNFDDKRIKIYKHKNSIGLPSSLNEAIINANGKYIARMDSDDISLVNRIESQVKYMEKNENIDICATYYKCFGNSKKVVKEKYIKPNDIKAKLFFTNIIAHPSVMFRKSSIEKYNLYYDTSFTYSQDFELWNRIIDVNIGILPKITLKYRIHNKQISSTKKEKQNEFYYKILCNNLVRIGLDEKYLNYILILNGRKKNNECNKIKDFIIMLIEKNKENKIYNQESFKKVLNRQYFIFCIKNRCYKEIIKNIKYI